MMMEAPILKSSLWAGSQLREIQRDHFVQFNRGYFDQNCTPLLAVRHLPVCNKQLGLSDSPPLRNLYPYFLPRHRNELANGTFHHHRIRQVYQMNGHRVPLSPNRNIQNSWTSNGY